MNKIYLKISFQNSQIVFLSQDKIYKPDQLMRLKTKQEIKIFKIKLLYP